MKNVPFRYTKAYAVLAAMLEFMMLAVGVLGWVLIGLHVFLDLPTFEAGVLCVLAWLADSQVSRSRG